MLEQTLGNMTIGQIISYALMFYGVYIVAMTIAGMVFFYIAYRMMK